MRRLAVLRQHPLKRAAVRVAQVAGVVTLGQHAGRRALDAMGEFVAAEQSSGARREHLSSMRGLSQRRSSGRAGEHMLPQAVSNALSTALDLVVQSFVIRAIRGRLLGGQAQPEATVPDVALEDVAGIGPAKAEALEIVECLMAPARFVGLGAKCPKGLLLTGPPGCGKTLLAKAIASAAAVPFISRSGADFNRVFAGAGSNLVKELFQSARASAPAVILIDELDYIGRRRGEERGGGLETDRSAALTQLLAEMDGFSPIEGVVVIATTNRPDILDKALLRPGRFDRRVHVPLPDVQGRLKILGTHAERLSLEENIGRTLTGLEVGSVSPVDLPGWAKRTSGFSGADLAGLVNEAAMAAAREGARGVGERHMQAAYSKALIGLPNGRHPARGEIELTAAHEAGHAVVNEAMRASLGSDGFDGFRTVAHISIVPAGGTGGVTQFAEPDERRRLPQTRRVLLAELAVCMGGRAAEEVVRGRGDATMGARSDFAEATRRAMDMVTVGGLSEVIGPRSLGVGVEPSNEMRRKVDAEVDALLRAALDAARDALLKNRLLLEVVTKALLDRETLDAEAFRQLVAKHEVKPGVLAQVVSK